MYNRMDVNKPPLTPEQLLLCQKILMESEYALGIFVQMINLNLASLNCG